MVRAYREHPDTVRVGSGVGFVFRADQFKDFKELILEGNDHAFVGRVVMGNHNWSEYKYAPEQRVTQALAELREEPDEKRFKQLFENMPNHDSDEDEEPVLLVKADDGLTQGLYRVRKPVRPTTTAYLETEGQDYLADGRHRVAGGRGSEHEKDELLKVGDLVYIYNFMYVQYTRGNASIQGESIALRGQVARNGWITIRSKKSIYAEKHPVFFDFDHAERTTKHMTPPAKAWFWYSWLILGERCQVWLHFVAAIDFLMAAVLIFLPEGQVNKDMLFMVAVVCLGGLVLGTVLVFVRQLGLYYCVSKTVRHQQTAREEVNEIKAAIKSVSNMLGRRGSMGQKVKELSSAAEGAVHFFGLDDEESGTKAQAVGKPSEAAGVTKWLGM